MIVMIIKQLTNFNRTINTIRSVQNASTFLRNNIRPGGGAAEGTKNNNRVTGAEHTRLYFS